ncbi:HlyD family efflux transporter periplasmic adaptor subunit [Spirulina major CS-329]|uniref:HlyD family efflux transporter periplasmic adaptor subunit n=1 Tax=Spirulina TaxID=1154 RepID=UPI00232CA31F|nr:MULTISPECIES: HlyD family efflux transporter periplasmic adaptor subunit [Spirulina]MDB9493867.1 HlyD family efflux transporter periplasmic adaptor subunit [Spirulina subsalsa CS-330]MDB9502844.1 HlyD family efflux transporter periplasmic adaptor subunit [Spirulina major CS-329]
MFVNVEQWVKRLKGRNGLISLVLLGLLTLGLTVFYGRQLLHQPDTEMGAGEEAAIAPLESITALGRIEPLGEVIQLSPPPALGGAKIERLLVEEGQTVIANQVVAQLDNYDRLAAALDKARQDVKVAESELARVAAGAQVGEIRAATARIERLQAERQGEEVTNQAILERRQAEVDHARTEYNRYQQLFDEGVVSASERDQRQLTLTTMEKALREAEAQAKETDATLGRQIQEAQADRDRIAEIRPVDLNQARARVAQAQAVVRQAITDLELGVVRSPIIGQVLQINVYPGEAIDVGAGILDIGRTDQMVVIAEIYESDIANIALDQTARITSENNAFTDELQGRVSQIGLQVGKKDVLDTDPQADIDVRVVEVEIRLDPADSRTVAGLTNAKVLVEIDQSAP